MPKKRISIPNVIKFELFYRCAKTCCVCQTNRVHHIHHIDKNPENNKIENLIGLCSNCHDEAHTKHELSRNLTQEQLLDLKTRWEAKVSNNSTKIMLPKNKTINNAAWTFINYDRIPYFLENYNIRFDRSRFNNLLASNAIDRDGIPQRLTKPKTIPYRTVYDYLPYELRHSLHHMYSDTINKLINKTKPINIEGTWSRSAIKALTPPGTICFLLRGFYFKKISTDNYTEERIAYRTERKIRLQFFINTRYMFGNSALFD